MVGAASGNPQVGASERRIMRRLARDVGVTVIANLIAAAIIYLLGVAAGLFPVSFLVWLAGYFLITGFVLLTSFGVMSSALSGARGGFAWGWTYIAFGLFAFATPLWVGTFLRQQVSLSWLPPYVWILAGGLGIFGGVVLLLIHHRYKRAHPGEDEPNHVAQRPRARLPRPRRHRTSHAAVARRRTPRVAGRGPRRTSRRRVGASPLPVPGER
jgi:MFS family permease